MRNNRLPTVEGAGEGGVAENITLGWGAVNMLWNELQQKELRMLGKSLLRVSGTRRLTKKTPKQLGMYSCEDKVHPYSYENSKKSSPIWTRWSLPKKSISHEYFRLFSRRINNLSGAQEIVAVSYIVSGHSSHFSSKVPNSLKQEIDCLTVQ